MVRTQKLAGIPKTAATPKLAIELAKTKRAAPEIAGSMRGNVMILKSVIPMARAIDWDRIYTGRSKAGRMF